MVATAFFTFFATLKIRAPYGRYSEAKGWGPLVHPTLAWIIMESPNIWLMFAMFRLCHVASDAEEEDRHSGGVLAPKATT